MAGKSLFCFHCQNPLEDDGTCRMCPKGITRRVEQTPSGCVWNDHGRLCGQPASMSDSTHGGTEWYCRDHYADLHGWPRLNPDAPPQQTYRERWYAERGLPYEDPKPGHIPVPRGFGPRAVRDREPGDDC